MFQGQSWSCAYILWFLVSKLSRYFPTQSLFKIKVRIVHYKKTMMADSSFWCHCGLVDETGAVMIVLDTLAAVAGVQGELHHCCILHGVPCVLMCVSARDVKSMCSATRAVYAFFLSLVCILQYSMTLWVHTSVSVS